MAIMEFRKLPSVNELLQTEQISELSVLYGRPLVLEAIRTTLDEQRKMIKQGKKPAGDLDFSQSIREQLENWLQSTLVPVINATGVILHTNLGRAPLSASALVAMQAAAVGYSTLEYDLVQGGRGSRHRHAEALLTRLTGAEAALVVNNNAAGVLLVLSALARRRRVIISRTQLVEIGGGFRIPEIMKQSGAILVEVGTTNRVHLEDYEEALQSPAAALLRAHHSNFRLVGFTSEPTLPEMAGIAQRYQVVLIDDLGSGALLDTARFGLAHEPMVQESVEAGADLVCFSGDKLLGGPQSGIIVGKATLVEKLKKNPLARAMRADKLCLSALSATLLHYLKDEAVREIPVWRMIALQADDVGARARKWVQALGVGEVLSSFSTIGGGSLPEETLPTKVLAIKARGSNAMLDRLRRYIPPIIARIENDQVVFDPRTVFPEQDAELIKGLKYILGNGAIQ